MIRMVINIRSIGMACMLLFCCFVVRGQAGAPKVCLDSVRVRLERAARLDSTYFSEIDLSIGVTTRRSLAPFTFTNTPS